MIREPRSIAEQIDCLARLTGAPGAFVDQVRELFTSKGISLQEEARPFLPALEEAFRREERIRCTTHRARQNLSKISDNFRRVGRAYVDQLSKLKGLRNTAPATRRKGPVPVEQQSSSTQVTIKGDHRTFVTRPVREELPMVPGPKEVQ